MRVMMTVDERRAAYADAFRLECESEYPVVDAFEQECGFAIERPLLEVMAASLACPLKVNPPNWQHGRVIYAAACRYLAERTVNGQNLPVNALDIGTAKGFSALCLSLAGCDRVTSVDVIDPDAAVLRNTVEELDRPLTLAQTIGRTGLYHRYVDSRVTFLKSTGIEWLERNPDRIHVAFVDGKHTGHVVRREGVLLSQRQESGDLAIFDDVHIPDVSQAVESLGEAYKIRYLEILPNRHYAIGVRR